MIPEIRTDTPVHTASRHGTEALLAAVHGNPVAMVNLARTLLMANGEIEHARAVCREALALSSHDVSARAEALALARPILSDGVGSWYFTMVLDAPRHALYARALRRILTQGGVVLDIGAGTGLFAMLAVRAGASRVIACERDAAVARAAQETIARNGFADTITVLPIDSRELQLAEPADVLLWDNLANNFLGAGCAATLADARERLIKPGAPILPDRCQVLAAAVTDLEAEERRMGVIEGLDMGAFNALRASDFTIGCDKIALRSTPATLFDFDVANSARISPARANAAITLSAGRVDGIAQWLRFDLGRDEAGPLIYDTLGEDVRAFGAQFHAMTPFDATDGMPARLHGAHDTLDTWFWLER